ncbi:hypothetical protein QQS21_007041 [Conoideocrella luteorostrata]|uniref:Uncharacterized protein n=1 Tax=Conoideocrella luteorostrata TaxID=1105319 RepID=A0AAJ0CLM6_9HYPO|nr:hypothetical protein QQS21_007041 [Conoideocrella luteorostrata]
MERNTSQAGHSPGSGSQAGPSRSIPGLSQPRRFEGTRPQSLSALISSQLTVAESWVEVASQPSSSSLSSIGDEIVTTGLTVGGPYHRRHRRRRLQASALSLPHQQTAIHAAGTSSQEEYDESESEEDRLLSSTENFQSSSPDVVGQASGAESDSDGDNATALGRASDRTIFRPPPNAFSHPPANGPRRSHSATSSMPPHPHSGFTRPSFSQRSQTRVHRGAPSFMSPSIREDNDAALRASLTTLLSCAAAARGLPKSKEEAEAWRASRNGVGPSNQPMELHFVPESELMKDDTQAQAKASATPRQRTRNSHSRSPTRAEAATDKSKRSVSAGRSPRANKKKKVAATADDTLMSPTLLTWVVSAGVVVLVSVVGFGAGYVIGREVGRQEAQDAFSASMSAANETSQTGREVIRSSSGLRRLRWGAGAVSRSIAAQA